MHCAIIFRTDLDKYELFFALQELRYYGREIEQFGRLCRQLYATLRENLLANIAGQYRETSFFWEHYNDVTVRRGGTR